MPKIKESVSASKKKTPKTKRPIKKTSTQSQAAEAKPTESRYEYRQPEFAESPKTQPNPGWQPEKLWREHKYLTLIVFTLVVLILITIFWLGITPRTTSEFEVQAQVMTPVELDMAELSFATSSDGENPEDLVELENLKAQEIQNYFLNKGVGSADIHRNQSYFSTTGQPALPAQNSLQTFYRVVMREVEEGFVQETVSGLYQIGLDRMDAVRFSSRNLTEICEDLRLEAMQQAEARAAEVIAQESGGQILEQRYETLVDCVGEDFSYFASSEFEQEKAKNIYGLADSSVSFSSQKQELKTQVKLTVTYQV
jgi:hypothetical protein